LTTIAFLHMFFSHHRTGRALLVVPANVSAPHPVLPGRRDQAAGSFFGAAGAAQLQVSLRLARIH
jgi:hypothetical protein